ncbi:hypothetical protein LZG04_10995 [Saccharothrix sp. S26]|uniref:hypothetical protein n=1 Tax=Saccharothrix sp. S26 TaxID=2907215 RepID=UPI001F36687C|nr:hypothetical protein [Saccharothrix sp. S26]MCE6995334.1 hypothetical protein [Saccharothrix sp. S26]
MEGKRDLAVAAVGLDGGQRVDRGGQSAEVARLLVQHPRLAQVLDRFVRASQALELVVEPRAPK